MTYGEFLMSLPSPTSFNVFSIKPLDGNCVLEINPSIAFPMLERLIGGSGDGFETNRELTDIEINLLDAILRIIMQRLKESWGPITDMYPAVLIVGNNSGMINICYPVIHLEPVLGKLANRDIMLGETNAKKSRNKELKTLIGRAEVLYEAILGRTIISVNEFLNLKEGDILKLNRSADDKAIVSIDKKDVFLAQIGIHRYRKSIRIEELIKTDKDEIKTILEQYEEERKARIKAYEDQDGGEENEEGGEEMEEFDE